MKCFDMTRLLTFCDSNLLLNDFFAQLLASFWTRLGGGKLAWACLQTLTQLIE